MPELCFYQPTWLDRDFKKAFRKLNQKEQRAREEQLVALLSALKICSHPTSDPALQTWRPSSYKGVAKISGGGRLIEYRLPGLMRVIACHFEAGVHTQNPGRRRERIVLLTVTLKHDHERMKRLIQQHRSGIAEST